MRDAYQEQLDELADALAGMCIQVADAMQKATRALLECDLQLAEEVISEDIRVDDLRATAEERAFALLALQAPVATDLRLVAALLHVIKHIERMGDQCVNMAKLVPLAGHEPPADTEMLEKIARMGELARSLTQQCKLAFQRRDAALAQDLVRQDDGIDRLNRECFHRALEIGDDADQREWAMHMMLIARCLERIGDNAVDIGEQTAFVVTGLFREFEDASHPELTPGGGS